AKTEPGSAPVLPHGDSQPAQVSQVPPVVGVESLGRLHDPPDLVEGRLFIQPLAGVSAQFFLVFAERTAHVRHGTAILSGGMPEHPPDEIRRPLRPSASASRLRLRRRRAGLPPWGRCAGRRTGRWPPCRRRKATR